MADAARAAGTPEGVLELVQSEEFLRTCLRKAKFEADLLQDTIDACEINDLTALILGTLTAADASQKLFLMQDEASTVVAVCRKECLRAGVSYGDGATFDPADAADEEPEPQPERPAPAPAMAPAGTSAASPQAPAPAAASPKQPQAAVSAGGASEGAGHPDPTFLIKPPVTAGEALSASQAASSSSTPTAAKSQSHIPRPSMPTPAPHDNKPASKPAPRASPATPSAATPAAKPASAAKPPLPFASPPAANGGGPPRTTPATKTPRPTSAPLLAARATPSSATNGVSRPQSAATTPAPLPSYAKLTAAHKARLTKEDEDSPSTSAFPAFASSTPKPLYKRMLYMPPRSANKSPDTAPKKPIFDNIRSSLLKPTAAFLAWTQGKMKKDNKDVDLKASQTLQAKVISQRSRQFSADEVQAAARVRAAAKTPDARRPSDMGSPSASKAATTPEPFHLSSMLRHQKAKEDLARKVEEKAKAESSYKPFKASPVPGSARSKGKWAPEAGPKQAAVDEEEADAPPQANA